MFFVLLSETENKFKKIISEGREKLEQLQEEKYDLVKTNENLVEDIESLESAIHNANTLIAEKSDDLSAKAKALHEISDSNIALSSRNEELQSNLKDERDAVAKLRVEIQELNDKLKAESVACEEEKSLCKSAYARECQQNKAQAEELVACLKKIQLENKTLNDTNQQLKIELSELELQLKSNTDTQQKSVSNEQVISSMQLEIDTKTQEIEELTKMHTTEYEKLREEKASVEEQLVDSNKERKEIETTLEKLRKEMWRIKTDAQSHPSEQKASSDSKSNDTTNLRGTFF